MHQQISITGRLGNDPELRYAPSGDAVTSFSIAAGRSWTDKDGNKVDKTVWFRVSIWGKQAEPCAQYLAKGRMAQVIGEIEPARVFTDRDGNQRASLEVKASQVIFLTPKDESAQSAPVAKAQASHPTPSNDVDIPF
jgi:single-strand DNA-binding protein